MRNSCAAFQRLLDFVTKGLPFVAVYIDDIIVSSSSHEEHIKHLALLFDRLCKYKLKIKPEKVQLATREIYYLGYNLIQGQGIRAGAAKIDAIKEWRMPTRT